MIIAIASGKGGTGKTMVATSLAFALKDQGPVQLLDCDVEEPNSHILLKPAFDHWEAVSIPVPKVDEAKCDFCGICARVCAYHAIAVFPKHTLVFPELCHGCGACIYMCPRNALSEIPKQIGTVESGTADGIEFAHGKLNIGGSLSLPIIRKVKAIARPDGTIIIDGPPGTSCPMVETIKGSDFCILVTEPTPFGLRDLTLAVETVKELGIQCGVVLNRAGINDHLIKDYCLQENIPILLSIPIDMEIARNYSNGITLTQGMPHWKDSFIGIFEQIRERVNEGSCSSKR